MQIRSSQIQEIIIKIPKPNSGFFGMFFKESDEENKLKEFVNYLSSLANSRDPRDELTTQECVNLLYKVIDLKKIRDDLLPANIKNDFDKLFGFFIVSEIGRVMYYMSACRVKTPENYELLFQSLIMHDSSETMEPQRYNHAEQVAEAFAILTGKSMQNVIRPQDVFEALLFFPGASYLAYHLDFLAQNRSSISEFYDVLVDLAKTYGRKIHLFNAEEQLKVFEITRGKESNSYRPFVQPYELINCLKTMLETVLREKQVIVNSAKALNHVKYKFSENVFTKLPDELLVHICSMTKTDRISHKEANNIARKNFGP